MLYNEKQKENYFEAAVISEMIKTYFQKTAPYEEILKKDVCQWNISEIISYYKSLCTPSTYYLAILNSQYKLYTNWCLAENLVEDGMNHFSEVNREVIQMCINTPLLNMKIVTREQLLHEISKFENDVDKFICLALFEGISGKDLKELLNLHVSDFNQETGLIDFGKKKVRYSPELYKLAKLAAAQTYYSKSEDKRDKYALIGDPDQIIKKTKSHNQQDDIVYKRNIIEKMVRFRDMYQCSFYSHKALNESGRIHTVKQLVAEGKYNTILEALNDTYVVNVYGLLNSRLAYIDKYKDYLQ